MKHHTVALFVLAAIFATGCAKKSTTETAVPATKPVQAVTETKPAPAAPAETVTAPAGNPQVPETKIQPREDQNVSAETRKGNEVRTPALQQNPTSARPCPGEDKSKPRLDYSPKPIFPSSLLDLCIEGEVRVKMRVTPEGKPEDVQILDSTAPAFGEAVKTVLPLWRFFPAEKDGVPVSRTVSISIPFVINNRPLDLSEKVTRGQPELVGVARPAHPGKGPAKALVKIHLTSDTIVSNVEIEKREGQFDEKTLTDTVSQWVFMPSDREKDSAPDTTVEAEVTFTGAGNVLIQYPYPAPKPETR